MAFLAPAAVGTTATATAAGAAAQGAAMGTAASSLAAASQTSTLLGTLSSIYSTVSPLLTVGSLAMTLSAGGTAAMAAQQMALANQQASLTEFEVDQMETAAMLRASERKRKMRRAVGQQLALYGASGVDALKGTPVDVMADTAKNFAFDQFSDDFTTSGQAYAGRIKASNQRAYGKQQAAGSLLDFGTRFALRG